MPNNVIDLSSRKKEKEVEEETDSMDFEEIARYNAAKAEKLAKEREAHNRRVKSDYKLRSKK